MTGTRRARRASRWTGLLVAALAAAAGCAQAQVLDLLYERTVMTAADRRCSLFTPAVSASLAAYRLQARGAALRAGATPETLTGIERRAGEKAAGLDCAGKDLAVAAGRVRS